MKIIITTPRSGSNLISAYIKRYFKLDECKELFNPDFLLFRKYLDEQTENKSVADFLNKSFPVGHDVIPKVLFSQFNFIRAWQDFSSLLGGKCLHLKRKNIIKQAISLFIAFETDQWTSQPNRPAKKSIDQIEYNFNRLNMLVNRIEYFNSVSVRLINIFGGRIKTVFYEDFLADQHAVLDDIGNFFDLPLRNEVAAVAVPFKSQTSEANKYFYDRYIYDIKSNIDSFDFSLPSFFRA